MRSRESSVGQECDEQQKPDPKRGQQVLDLLQDLQNLLNLKDLKTMLANRQWNELPGVLKDIRKAYQDAMDQQQQLQDEHRTLQIKYLDLNERFTNLQT